MRDAEIQNLKKVAAKQHVQIQTLKRQSLQPPVRQTTQQAAEVKRLNDVIETLTKERDFYKKRLSEATDLSDWRRCAERAKMPINASAVRRASRFIEEFSA